MKKEKEYNWEKETIRSKKSEQLQQLPSIEIHNNTPKLENLTIVQQPPVTGVVPPVTTGVVPPVTSVVPPVAGVVPSAPLLEEPSYQYSTFNPMCLDYNVDSKSVCKVCHIKIH